MHLLLLLLHLTLTTAEPSLTLVRNGQSQLTILMPANAGKYQKLAINDFVSTIKRASGADVAVRGEGELRSVSKGQTVLVFGPGALADSLLGRKETIQPEEFKIITKGNYLIVLAKEIDRTMEQRGSLGTSFALSHLMETYMGVKWLWPGELGTHVPPMKTITLPALNVAKQPKLVRRRFNLATKNPDLLLWASHHRASGERISYNFMHSFRKIGQNGDWWADFYETKPYLLAQSPNGKPEKLGRDEFFKVCTSHPETADEVLRRWEKAGMPDTWDLTENDGKGWCTCDRCRAVDKQYGGVEYSKEDIWYGRDHVNLTERHVWFWNTIVKRMRQKNPRTQVLVFLYSNHREPPRNQKLEPGILGELVHGYDFRYWHEWTKAGVAGIGLRPNWWHMGANAPHLPLHTVGPYIEKAHQNRMTHLFMDSLNEYWATQGPYYYLVGRLADHPELTTDAIIDEYCSAFGKAARDVREYLDYWETYHKKVAYNIPAGGRLSVDSTGLYERVSREKFKDVLHPLSGHWRTLPYLYPPAVMDGANAILSRALNRARNDSLTVRRIGFLQDGLRHVTLTADYIRAEKADKEARLTTLAEFDKAMKQKHGYWGTREINMMKEWGLVGKEFSVDDM